MCTRKKYKARTHALTPRYVTIVRGQFAGMRARPLGRSKNSSVNPGAPDYTPFFYLEATVPLDGSQLTSNLVHGPSAVEVAQTGHIVSSPDGTVGSWVVRASWGTSDFTDSFNVPSLLNGAVVDPAEVGLVRVYEYIASSANGWVARPGGDLELIGQNAGDNLGARRSVAMSDDGLVVAVGSPGTAPRHSSSALGR